MATDFFDYPHHRLHWAKGHRGRLADRAMDALLPTRRLDILADQAPVQRVLVAGISVPGRQGDIAQVVMQLGSRHTVDASIVGMGKRGKFENVNRAIASRKLQAYDWLLIVDDDVDLGPRFLDQFIALALHFRFDVAMPAHRLASYSTFEVTRRQFGIARLTRFVEIGPVTLIHKNAFALVPFPELRWGWGLDVEWSQVAADNGWRMGVIDATPITHLRPIGGSYGSEAAIAEARAYLAAKGIAPDVTAMMAVGESLRL